MSETGYHPARLSPVIEKMVVSSTTGGREHPSSYDASNYFTQALLWSATGKPFDRADHGIWTGDDALQPQPDPQWPIDGYISAGSLGSLVGDPGGGKTYLIVDACVAVASGQDWLGRKTIPSPVLVIDEESGDSRLKARIGAVMRARNVSGIPLFAQCLKGYDLRTYACVFTLKHLIEQLGARLVLIDTLAAVTPGAEENASKDMQPLLMQLRRVAEETGAAIQVIHHTNKNGGYRGSTSILGAVDTMAQVERRTGSGMMLDIRSIKVRDGAAFTFSASMHFEGAPGKHPTAVYVTPEEPSERPKEWSKGERYVLRYLSENGPADVKTIMARADSCAATTARTAVYSLAEVREIVRVDGGKPGESATYALRSSKGTDDTFRDDLSVPF
jgi:hypothetical protein